MQIAKKTIDDKIANGESFSWDGIQEEIIKKGGILGISGQSMQIAKKTIDDKIADGESFSWDGIQEEIIKKGGILGISAVI